MFISIYVSRQIAKFNICFDHLVLVIFEHIYLHSFLFALTSMTVDDGAFGR